MPRLTLLLAGITSVAVEMLVADPGRSPWSAAGFGLVQAVVAVLIYAALSANRVFNKPMPNLVLIGFVAALAAPFVMEPVRRTMLGVGRPNEIILIDSFRLLTLTLAALGGWKNCLYPAAVASLFLMLFAAALSENPATGYLLSLFVAASAWWLAEASWEDLAEGFREHRRRLPASAMLVAAATIVAVTSLAQSAPQRWAAVLGEWISSSGGTGEHDPYARGGVNDGDQLASGDDPRSGGGDGDQYIESNEPTLYDAMNDQFGETLKPSKKQQRAIALSSTNVTETHKEPARGDSAQREFSIARRSPPRPRPLRDLQAEALFSVQGPTPLHLPLKRYDRFDGLAWEECNSQRSKTELQSLGGDWLGLPEPTGQYVAGPMTHKIKLGRLRSRRLPLPLDTTRFRLGAAGRPDFFHLSTEGSLDLDDPTGHVPAGEHLHTVETTIDRRLCADLGSTVRPLQADSNLSDSSPALFGDYVARPEVLALADEWTRDAPPGWRQVEAIIARLRAEYRHDREVVAPTDHPDPIAWFLLESRCGPDYLFAGSAAVLLKSLGWPVHVVSGGYADPAKYDRAANYTHVGGDDLHFWLEARLPDGLWLPLEPTPGYELAPHVRTWSEWLRSLIVAIRASLAANVGVVVVALLALGGLYFARRDVANVAATLRWLTFSRGSKSTLVAETLRLIETRQRLAGAPRPAGKTPRRFFHEQATLFTDDAAREPVAEAALLALFDLHDRAAFGSLDGTPREVARRVCQDAVACWPWRKFESAAGLRQAPPSARRAEPVAAA